MDADAMLKENSFLGALVKWLYAMLLEWETLKRSDPDASVVLVLESELLQAKRRPRAFDKSIFIKQLKVQGLPSHLQGWKEGSYKGGHFPLGNLDKNEEAGEEAGPEG